HGWSQDGKHIVYEGETAQHEWNVYIQSVKGELPTLLKRGGHNSYPTLSPDGSVVALHEMSGGISLYRIGEQPPTPLKGAEESEYPIRFIEGGRSLLVGKSTGDELALTRIDIGTGKRRPWKSFHSTGLVDQLMVATPNLEYYAYPSGRGASILYIVDNLH
ncbi:MAG: PD40 domain-containing protein, partial [Acidobacteria bacterium]|nr:PD40 domain-containing protein [Acidobacteriota bacterium]